MSSNTDHRQAKVKLVLLGESAVGKTTLVTHFIQTQFTPNIQSTIGAAFITKTLDIDSLTSVKFEIWDTAGQERYKSLAPMYYRGADFAIVVFDMSELAVAGSWDRALRWIEELKIQGLRSSENGQNGAAGGGGVIVKLVGNKCDLVREGANQTTASGLVTEDTIFSEVERLNREGLKIEFVKTSAKTGQGVKELFMGIAEDVPDEKFQLANNDTGSSGTQGKGIDLSATNFTVSSCNC